eukprot:3775824-Ditylum_brightwellii.AAC.1
MGLWDVPNIIIPQKRCDLDKALLSRPSIERGSLISSTLSLWFLLIAGDKDVISFCWQLSVGNS